MVWLIATDPSAQKKYISIKKNANQKKSAKPTALTCLAVLHTSCTEVELLIFGLKTYKVRKCQHMKYDILVFYWGAV